MDEFGNELDYPNYHREKMPPVDGPEDWVRTEFNVYKGSGPILVAGAWLTDSETSRMRDGKWVPFAMILKPGEKFLLHFRTAGGMNAAQQFI